MIEEFTDVLIIDHHDKIEFRRKLLTIAKFSTVVSIQYAVNKNEKNGKIWYSALVLTRKKEKEYL